MPSATGSASRSRHPQPHLQPPLREPEGVQGVEAGLLVFLEIPLVARRESLPHGEERHQIADQPAGLSADQLAAVGVALLGHQTRPRGPGVAEAHEAELGGRPEHEVLREPREVHPEDRARGEELHRVVAGSHRVHAVVEDFRESELAGDRLAVHRVGVPGERAGAHRRRGRPPAGGPETPAVARQSPEVRQQQVAEDHRLGALQVGVSRDQGVRRLLGPDEQRAPEPVERLDQRRRCARQVEPELRLGEIVPTPSGREFPGQLADLIAEQPLDRGVDVLVVEGRRRIGAEHGRHPVESREHPLEFAGIQHPRSPQSAGVGLVDADLLRVQPAVEVDGLPQPVERAGRRRGEPAAPELHDSSFGASAPDRRRMRSGRPKRRMNPSASDCRYTSSAPKVAKSSR